MKLQDILRMGETISRDRLPGQLELTQQIQVRLLALGLLSSAADGHYGPRTAAALSAFCAAFNLPTESVTPEVAKQLIQCRKMPGICAAHVVSILGCPIADAQTYLPEVVAALKFYKIWRRPTAIATIATIGVETGGFRPICEYGGDRYFTEQYEARDDLGNFCPGDGPLFKGRGFVQITGRANYRRYGEKLGVDLENKPDLALEPKVSAQVLALYFYDRKVDVAAAAGDWIKVRRLVNGGTNGLDEFLRFVETAEAVLRNVSFE